jgi:SAM-dependent methyltransferase
MWDERFSKPGFTYGSEPNDFLREHAKAIPQGRVLVLGAGEGRNGVWLAQQGHPVLCVDGSRVGLAKAQSLAASRGVTIETMAIDLSNFAIAPASFTGIVSIWCHLPEPLRQKVHAACVAGLKPGGAFILEAYTPEQLKFATGGPKDVSMLPTLEQLKRELRGLTFEVGRQLERDVREGALHEGTSATVQVVARR